MTAQQDAYKIGTVYILISTVRIQENAGKSPTQLVTFMNN